MESERRRFLAATPALGIGNLATAAGPAQGDDKAKDDKKGEPEEVAAAEELMREHGVLNRILLIYEEGLRRLRDKEEVSPDAFHKPALLVRKFVEDYHEELEENFIFSEFEKRKKLVDLVKVLREQHQAGGNVTDVILRNAVPDQFRKEGARTELVAASRAFIRMYRPHEAREDTLLFPALHTVISAKQLSGAWRGPSITRNIHPSRLFGVKGISQWTGRLKKRRSELVGCAGIAIWNKRRRKQIMAKRSGDIWFVYLLHCADGSLYTGITKDVSRRCEQHNAGAASRYTRSRRPTYLVYQEAHRSKGAALKREAAIKALSRREKESMIRLAG